MKPTFLKNPKTDTYNRFKDLVLSQNFSWFRWSETIEGGSQLQKGYEDFPFLSHRFLTRPLNSCLYSQINSEYVEHMQQVFREIADFNGLDPQIIYRMNANAVHPTENNLPSPVHVDHTFPHNIMIIYLTDPQGGSTIVEGKEYMANEDDVLIFDGKPHCVRPPRKDIRIVLVITFL
jgi:hypothetical protein